MTMVCSGCLLWSSLGTPTGFSLLLLTQAGSGVGDVFDRMMNVPFMGLSSWTEGFVEPSWYWPKDSIPDLMTHDLGLISSWSWKKPSLGGFFIVGEAYQFFIEIRYLPVAMHAPQSALPLSPCTERLISTRRDKMKCVRQKMFIYNYIYIYVSVTIIFAHTHTHLSVQCHDFDYYYCCLS